MRPISLQAHDVTKVYTIGKAKDVSLRTSIASLFDHRKTSKPQHIALDRLSFEVQQGEALGIIGRNGAGKSTLLKILSKITRPTSGEIEVWGKVASLLEVGTGFHPELTGKENIFLSGAVMGMKNLDIKRRYDEIVEFSGVSTFLETPVKRYSSGMYVRLAFAVAAHLESDILLVDEVLAVGDAEFQKKCLGKMQDISARNGRTVVFVSHNMQVINQLCSKAMFLSKGKLEFIGSPNDAIHRYLSHKTNESRSTSGVFSSSDPDFQFENIQFSQLGEKSTSIQNALPLEISITYTLTSKIVGLQLGFDLLDANYARIARSFFYENALNFIENAPPTLLPGTYTSKAILPSDTLLPGRYFINVSASIFGNRMIEPEDGIESMIEVVETGKYLRSIYSSHFQGIITLPVTWNTNS